MSDETGLFIVNGTKIYFLTGASETEVETARQGPTHKQTCTERDNDIYL